MQIPPIVQAGLAQAVRRFDASAQRVARAGSAAGRVDLAAQAVEQVAASRAVSSNLAALKTADELEKRLLDIKA